MAGRTHGDLAGGGIMVTRSRALEVVVTDGAAEIAPLASRSPQLQEPEVANERFESRQGAHFPERGTPDHKVHAESVGEVLGPQKLERQIGVSVMGRVPRQYGKGPATKPRYLCVTRWAQDREELIRQAPESGKRRAGQAHVHRCRIALLHVEKEIGP